MAQRCYLLITVRPRWWLPIYLRTLIFLCQLFGAEPHWERVNYWVRRGLLATVRRIDRDAKA